MYFHSKQLLIEAGYEERVDELIDFVRTLGVQDNEQLTTGKAEDKEESVMIILQTVEDLLSTASAQPITKVHVTG